MAVQPDLVAQAVRASDRERYVSALYAPAERRDALLALYAFNAEVAGIRDRIREPLAGEVRLQWWRDVIADRRPGAATGSPIADALLSAIERYSLPETAFLNLLDARVFDLYDDPMPSRTDLEGYCGETAGAIIQLSALVLDAEAAPQAADLAGHAGCAQAIAGLLRLLPIHRARGQCYVPRDILAAAGTTPEAFVAGDADAAAAAVAVAAMVALAQEHLDAFRRGAGDLPPSLRPAFLPLAPVEAHLAAVGRKGARALTEIGDLPAWRLQWILFRAATRGW